MKKVDESMTNDHLKQCFVFLKVIVSQAVIVAFLQFLIVVLSLCFYYGP